MAADPQDNPTIYEHPTLDSIPIPGTRVVRTGGGERTMKVEQQQQPGFAGAFTLVKIEDMATVSYRIDCADKPARDAVNAWLPAMRAAQKSRPKPTVFRFYDPALEHNEIRNVIVQRVGGWQKDDKSGMWSVDVALAEWKKRVPIGGAAGPRPKSDIEKQIEDLNAQNKALDAQLAALKKGK